MCTGSVGRVEERGKRKKKVEGRKKCEGGEGGTEGKKQGVGGE